MTGKLCCQRWDLLQEAGIARKFYAQTVKRLHYK